MDAVVYLFLGVGFIVGFRFLIWRFLGDGRDKTLSGRYRDPKAEQFWNDFRTVVHGSEEEARETLRRRGISADDSSSDDSESSEEATDRGKHNP
ncbi:MAG: hypothetical protein Q8Q00_04720 [Dehalococcoidia bacterium]|nr:hypothetical protein [Dehalococcoidia bacterium]